MKKIAFYINTLHLGGAERVVVNLADYFSENGYQVVVIASFQDVWEYPVKDKVKKEYLECKESKAGFITRNIQRTKQLRKILKQEKIDLLISFMAEPNFRALAASIGLPVKTIISIRNDPDKEYKNRIFYLAQRLLYPLADGVVFQTENAQKWFPYRIQQKSEIIMNAVAQVFFHTSRGYEDGYFVACGRLEPQKNYKMMINAFLLVHQKFADERLYIYGDGSLKNELQEYIKEKKLDKVIFLKGVSNHIPEVLSKAKVFLLSSDYEGMPNALLEAMAMGIPSISTDCPCGGPRMVIRNGENGKLVKTGDDKAMAEAMIEILQNSVYADKLSENARKTALDYSYEKICIQWKVYIDHVLID